MDRFYYMAVTPDEYELPLIVEETLSALARKLNLNQSSVSCRIVRDAKVVKSRSGYKVVKIRRE